MDSKAFLALVITLNTAVILIGIYFIATFASTQSYEQFKSTQAQADQRFERSQLVHGNQTNNIVGEFRHLNDRLDPILDQIPNATQSEIDRQIHYNQTSEDFDKLAKVLQIKLEDHVTLGIVNQSVGKILEILNKTEGTNGTIIPVPIPVNNGTVQPLPLPLVNR